MLKQNAILCRVVYMDALWNILLTAGLGIAGFVLRFMWTELQRVQILLNRTREEIARECVTWERLDRERK